MKTGLLDTARRLTNAAILGTRPATAREFRLLRASQWYSPEEIGALQRERLQRLLDHAYRKVPYYTELFERCGIARGGELSPDRFASIPLLTKSIFRERARSLCSTDLAERNCHENRTGGSTGEPLVLIQERADVEVSGGAVLRMFYGWLGVRPGDSEIKLWGSDRDLFVGKASRLGSLRQWLQGVELLNAFRMSPERMGAYVDRINRVRPALLRGYSSNLVELARFADEQGLRIRPPRFVISSAGTLYPEMRVLLERVFGCKVVNHYGSRDMHNMAMECEHQNGLHISSLTHLIEVLDESGSPCAVGEEGNLVITALTNYSQPLIRYCIGDRGVRADDSIPCPCGRGLEKLERVSGRRADCFRTRAGKVVPGEYFIYLLGVFLEDTPFSKIQAVQKDYDHVVVRLKLKPDASLDPTIEAEIVEKTKLVMGEDCRVEIAVVSEIPPLANGKYPYTISCLPTAADFDLG